MVRGATLIWIGGPSHLLRLGPFVVLSDPVFGDRIEMPEGAVDRLSAPPDVDLSSVDAVCVSCLRADHFDRSVYGRLGAGAETFVPHGSAAAPGGESAAGVRELGWHQETRLEKGTDTLTITAVPARSDSGDDNGYHYRLTGDDGEFTAYCTGDAVWSDDIPRIQRELGHVDLLIPHLGAEGGASALTSAGAREAMQFVYRMQPRTIVPVHHSTFSHYTEPIGAFAESVGRTIYERRLRLPREGEPV